MQILRTPRNVTPDVLCIARGFLFCQRFSGVDEMLYIICADGIDLALSDSWKIRSKQSPYCLYWWVYVCVCVCHWMTIPSYLFLKEDEHGFFVDPHALPFGQHYSSNIIMEILIHDNSKFSILNLTLYNQMHTQWMTLLQPMPFLQIRSKLQNLFFVHPYSSWDSSWCWPFRHWAFIKCTFNWWITLSTM